MGVRGLTGMIRWAAPAIIKTPDWSQFHDKKIGIDILGFLYKTKAHKVSPFIYIANFIAACKEHSITPVMIFDGKPPDEKRAALKQRTELRMSSESTLKTLESDLVSVPLTPVRRSVIESKIHLLSQNASYFTSEERDLVKQLCYACGVMSLNATGEADDVLAYLSLHSEIDAVISNDLDLLARGVETLLVPGPFALPGDSDGWIQYSLKDICTSIGFTYEQFVEMCVLMGTDYTIGHKTLPYKSSYWAIKYRGKLSETLNTMYVTNHEPYLVAKARLMGEHYSKDTLMNEKQWEKWYSGPPTREIETLVEFQKSLLDTLPSDTFTILVADSIS